MTEKWEYDPEAIIDLDSLGEEPLIPSQNAMEEIGANQVSWRFAWASPPLDNAWIRGVSTTPPNNPVEEHASPREQRLQQTAAEQPYLVGVTTANTRTPASWDNDFSSVLWDDNS